MTERVPRTVFVQTLRSKSRSRLTVLGVRYEFILIISRKFFGVTKQWSSGAESRITDREKMLIEALDRPDPCGGIPVVAGALADPGRLDWDRFDTYLRSFSSDQKRNFAQVQGVHVPPSPPSNARRRHKATPDNGRTPRRQYHERQEVL